MKLKNLILGAALSLSGMAGMADAQDRYTPKPTFKTPNLTGLYIEAGKEEVLVPIVLNQSYRQEERSFLDFKYNFGESLLKQGVDCTLDSGSYILGEAVEETGKGLGFLSRTGGFLTGKISEAYEKASDGLYDAGDFVEEKTKSFKDYITPRKSLGEVRIPGSSYLPRFKEVAPKAPIE